MKRINMLCVLFAVCCGAHGQIVTIKDFETQLPLEMVVVESDVSKSSLLSNKDGDVDISEFKNAARIYLRLIGYQTQVRSYKELTDSSYTLFLIPASISMSEIVISASRWNQSSRDVPAKITRISMKEMALQNPQTAADLLGFSGKVFIQKSQQGGGSPMIRGFSTNRLLYTVDGVRMNTAIFRSGNLQNVISLDPFAMENVEVLFGPGSVIYGSDAIGGVMTFQTLTPQLSENKTRVYGKALTRYSSANRERTVHMDVGIGGKHWASVTSISVNQFGHLKMGSHGPEEYLRYFYVQRVNDSDQVVKNTDPRKQFPSAYSQMNLMQKLRFSPNKKWDFQYGFHYSETSPYARYDRHIRYRNGSPRYGQWDYGPQVWMMNNLAVTHKGENKLYNEVTIRFAQQKFEESRIDRDINSNERHIREEYVKAYSLNADFRKTMGSRQILFYGLEGVQNKVVSKGIDENISTGDQNPGPARYPQSLWTSYAVYASYQLKISDKFLFQTGLRYTIYGLDALFDTTFYPFPYARTSSRKGALTGSAGFVYRPAKKLALSVNLSSGFRAPNVDDAGKVFDSEPGAVVIPNPDLRAEQAYNAELSVVKVMGSSLKIDVTGYYTLLQNALVRRDFTLNGQDSIVYDGTLSKVQAVQNAAHAKVYGLQAGIEIKLPLGFAISSDINFQKGTEQLDDGTLSPSRHAPPAFGAFRIIYSHSKLTMQLYTLFSGEQRYSQLPQEEKGKVEIYAVDTDGNPWSPSWYTLNFKALFQINSLFSISTGIENITDQRYRPFSSGIVAPGRNFILALKVVF